MRRAGEQSAPRNVDRDRARRCTLQVSRNDRSFIINRWSYRSLKLMGPTGVQTGLRELCVPSVLFVICCQSQELSGAGVRTILPLTDLFTPRAQPMCICGVLTGGLSSRPSRPTHCPAHTHCRVWFVCLFALFVFPFPSGSNRGRFRYAVRPPSCGTSRRSCICLTWCPHGGVYLRCSSRQESIN